MNNYQVTIESGGISSILEVSAIDMDAAVKAAMKEADTKLAPYAVGTPNDKYVITRIQLKVKK